MHCFRCLGEAEQLGYRVEHLESAIAHCLSDYPHCLSDYRGGTDHYILFLFIPTIWIKFIDGNAKALFLLDMRKILLVKLLTTTIL